MISQAAVTTGASACRHRGWNPNLPATAADRSGRVADGPRRTSRVPRGSMADSPVHGGAVGLRYPCPSTASPLVAAGVDRTFLPATRPIPKVMKDPSVDTGRDAGEPVGSTRSSLLERARRQVPGA